MVPRRPQRWLARVVLIAAACLALGQNCAGPAPSPNLPVASACGLNATYCVEVVGKSPLALAGGDFNVDGAIDLAVANFGTDNVEVLLNDGTGRMTPSGKYKVGDSPGGLVAIDFNRDGYPDVAASNGYGVSVLLNRRDATLDRAVHFWLDQSINAFPVAVTAGDLDGDGTPDLATTGIGWILDFVNVTYANADNVSVLLNDGSGRFTIGQTLIIDNPYSRLGYIAAGDLSGDGRTDLVIDQSSGKVTVLVNQANGTVSESYSLDLGTDHLLGELKLADLNGDGGLDLIVADGGDPLDPNDAGSVVICWNVGGVLAFGVRMTAGAFPTSVAVADYNADAWPDLAVANNVSDDVSILLNQGGGAFLPARSFVTGDGPTSVVAADYDADGDIDLGVSHMLSGVVGVYLNNGTGCFTCGQ